MKRIRLVWADALTYWRFYLVRGVFLQLILTGLGSLALSEAFQLVLVLARQDQLTQANWLQIFLNPYSLFGSLFFLFLLLYLVYVEFLGLVNIIRRKDREMLWSWSAWFQVLKQWVRQVVGWQVLLLVAYLVLTIPTVHLLLSSTFFQDLYIPYFITDELMKQPLTATGLLVLGAGAYYLNLRLIYTLPLMALDKECSFWDNLKRSWTLTRNGLLGLVLSLMLLFLPLALFMMLLVFLLLFLLLWLQSQGLSEVFQWAVVSFMGGLFFALTAFNRLLLVSFLLGELDAGGLLPSYRPLPRVSKKRWLSLAALLFALGLGQMALNYQRWAYDPYNKEVETVAHRGDVTKGVENSLEALEAAAQAGVDYVEMDIILSQDGQFVVSHDNNLKRLTGQRRLISQSPAADVIGLPIVQDGKTSQLVSFETYVAKAKELGVKLMVELKPHGSEPDDYAQRAIAALRELGVSRDYKLMSLDSGLMAAIEAQAPEIETGYIIPFQFGNLSGQELDFLLIEDFSYRDRLVWEAQWRDQELYVWTINREEQMSRYLQSPVAGMITDDPDLVLRVKAELSASSGLVDRLLRLLD